MKILSGYTLHHRSETRRRTTLVLEGFAVGVLKGVHKGSFDPEIIVHTIPLVVIVVAFGTPVVLLGGVVVVGGLLLSASPGPD